MADLGVLVPLVAALVVVNGFAAGPVLVLVGLVSLAAGLWFRIPFPVQPLKAMTALAVAQQLAPGTVRAAGLLLGVIPLVLRFSGLDRRLAAAFTTPVVRALQLGVGVMLVETSARLLLHPPAALASGVPSAGRSLLLGAGVLGLVALAVHRRWYALVPVAVVAGAAATWLVGAPGTVAGATVTSPSFGLPSPTSWWAAFVLLVVPQLPLTFGNAVVGTAHLARESFPTATRVTPGAVALSCGLANVAAAFAGGIPVCHGSSGLTAHLRLGARTWRTNAILGGGLVAVGLLLAGHAVAVLSLLPLWMLAGLLAYTGLRHAALVLDLRGPELAVALLAASGGVLAGNLAVTTGLALGGAWLPRLRSRALATPT